MKKPRLTIIAGANGCGKSTLTRWNREIFRDVPILDPDTLSDTIQSTITAGSAIAAGRKVLEIAASNLVHRRTFAVETTLSGRSYLRMMEDAHSRGFEIVLVYIGTKDVETNLARIADRVQAGGHNVPEADVRRRFRRSFENLSTAVSRADHTILFDNSSERGYWLVSVLHEGRTEWLSQELPEWAVPLRLQVS